MTDRVGIVIVSHSAEVARGTVDMVRQMVGHEVPVACSGGNPAGGLGTDVASIMAATEAAGGGTLEQVRATAEELSP